MPSNIPDFFPVRLWHSLEGSRLLHVAASASAPAPSALSLGPAPPRPRLAPPRPRMACNSRPLPDHARPRPLLSATGSLSSGQPDSASASTPTPLALGLEPAPSRPRLAPPRPRTTSSSRPLPDHACPRPLLSAPDRYPTMHVPGLFSQHPTPFSAPDSPTPPRPRTSSPSASACSPLALYGLQLPTMHVPGLFSQRSAPSSALDSPTPPRPRPCPLGTRPQTSSPSASACSPLASYGLQLPTAAQPCMSLASSLSARLPPRPRIARLGTRPRPLPPRHSASDQLPLDLGLLPLGLVRPPALDRCSTLPRPRSQPRRPRSQPCRPRVAIPSASATMLSAPASSVEFQLPSASGATPPASSRPACMGPEATCMGPDHARPQPLLSAPSSLLSFGQPPSASASDSFSCQHGPTPICIVHMHGSGAILFLFHAAIQRARVHGSGGHSPPISMRPPPDSTAPLSLSLFAASKELHHLHPASSQATPTPLGLRLHLPTAVPSASAMNSAMQALYNQCSTRNNRLRLQTSSSVPAAALWSPRA